MFDGYQTESSGRIAVDWKDYLAQLQAERALASLLGLDANIAYLSDLDDELVAARQAYIGMAVTEIAALRAQLSSPQLG
jgi:hypothetical protein